MCTDACLFLPLSLRRPPWTPLTALQPLRVCDMVLPPEVVSSMLTAFVIMVINFFWSALQPRPPIAPNSKPSKPRQPRELPRQQEKTVCQEPAPVVIDPKAIICKLFINNEFRDAKSSQTFPSVNPATGEVICEVAKAEEADVDEV